MTTAILDMPVLVLNKNYQPVAVARVGRAFSLLFSGVVKALDDEYRTFDYDSWAELAADGEAVHTTRHALRVPKVIVLQAYNRMPRSRIRFSRNNVYLRDDFTCQFCNVRFTRSSLNLDHVIPRAQGGRTCWENVVCSCIKCNTTKADRTPAQAGMTLRKVPARPTWSELSPLSMRTPPKEWLPFIDNASAAYWNTELASE